jgi:cytoskeletal protein RodZ
MKTIGEILKSARVSKKYSLNYVADLTKIKAAFIDAIERHKWEKLPPFPTVLGFVKSLATSLGVDSNMAVAVLKRDYPPQKLNINPKPDVSSKFIWSPKLTFAIGVGAILLVVLGYLVFQYLHFVSPPDLTIDSPKDNQIVTGNSVLVFGKTETDAKIIVNNQPVLVTDDGKFSVSMGVTKDTKEINVKAISRSGKETTVSRKIVTAQ